VNYTTLGFHRSCWFSCFLDFPIIRCSILGVFQIPLTLRSSQGLGTGPGHKVWARANRMLTYVGTEFAPSRCLKFEELKQFCSQRCSVSPLMSEMVINFLKRVVEIVVLMTLVHFWILGNCNVSWIVLLSACSQCCLILSSFRDTGMSGEVFSRLALSCSPGGQQKISSTLTGRFYLMISVSVGKNNGAFLKSCNNVTFPWS